MAGLGQASAVVPPAATDVPPRREETGAEKFETPIEAIPTASEKAATGEGPPSDDETAGGAVAGWEEATTTEPPFTAEVNCKAEFLIEHWEFSVKIGQGGTRGAGKAESTPTVLPSPTAAIKTRTGAGSEEAVKLGTVLEFNLAGAFAATRGGGEADGAESGGQAIPETGVS